jgi:hypothetical protein
VLVFNPNYTKDPETGDNIQYSSNSAEHVYNIWGSFVTNSGLKQVNVIAHREGGNLLYKI